MSVVTTTWRRRNAELYLGLLAVVITAGGYVLLALSEGPALPANLWFFLGVLMGLYVVAHIAVRSLAPRADATLLPLAAVLNGIGFITITRIDRDATDQLAPAQAMWTAVGVLAFIGTLVIVRRVALLERYRYTFLLFGIVALLLPLAPGIGTEINGARLWVRLGPINFQPGELAKVLLVVFLAGYLVDKREVLARGVRRIGRLRLPAAKHMGPLFLAWGFSLLVMIRQKDLGSSLLFFAVFAVMLYIATERTAFLIAGGVLFVTGAAIGYAIFGHVQDRVSVWVDPWTTGEGQGFQIVQSMFALGTGGFAGTGLGLGRPNTIPNAATDFVFSAIGEELGLLGTAAVIIGFLLFVGAGYRIAVQADRPFPKLFAAGLTSIIGIQTFIIIGGVTRLIPLTGITLPFVSYGGSSLIANFVVLALLLRISDETAERAAGRAAQAGAVTRR
jgi:cell division protein FtsW (lipid II flippase)